MGARLPIERLAHALLAQDRPARTWNQGEGLTTALVELERELEADPPAAVLLADDSDAALAAALVATKLLVPVAAVEEAAAGDGVNARLISQLAAAYTPPR